MSELIKSFLIFIAAIWGGAAIANFTHDFPSQFAFAGIMTAAVVWTLGFLQFLRAGGNYLQGNRNE